MSPAPPADKGRLDTLLARPGEFRRQMWQLIPWIFTGGRGGLARPAQEARLSCNLPRKHCDIPRAALGIEKCMRSAIANANEAAEKANVSIDPDDLWVKAAYVDRGPTKNRRRVRPAPQGRAYREQRHFSKITWHSSAFPT